MGNPANPIIANFIMKYLLKSLKMKVNFNISLLKLYVDDTILAIPKTEIATVLELLNSFYKNLQFTYELENNKTIRFLDLQLINNKDGTISTT